jgi:hypothetical protein
MAYDLRAMSREWFDVVWNKRDDAGIARLASSQMICHGLDAGGKPAPGLDTFLQKRKAFLSAFPDIRVTVEDVLLDGNKTAESASPAPTTATASASRRPATCSPRPQS